MNDIERLLGELQEFKRATISELHELKKEIRSLIAFKWKAAGVMGTLLALIEVAHIFLKGE